jgi:uncharacterized protein involved in exopolysaccharide biosynthesis
MIPGRVYTPATILDILRRRLWLVAVAAVIATGVAVMVAKRMPNVYAAQSIILALPPPQNPTVVKQQAVESLEYRLLAITPQILKPEQLERIILELDLYPELRKTAPMPQVIETMRRGIIGPRVVRSDAFAIGFIGYWPHKVTMVTQQLAGLFIDENLKNREKRATDNSNFFGSQLEETARRLREKERALEEYRTRNAPALPSQMAANLQVLKSTQDQAQAVQDALSRDRERRSDLEQTLIEAQRQLEGPADEPTDSQPVAVVEPTTPAASPDAPANASAAPAAAQPEAVAKVDPANNPDMNFGAPGTPTNVRLQNARKYLDSLTMRGLRPAHPEMVRARKIVDQLEKGAAEQTVANKGRPPAGSPAAQMRAANLAAAQRRLAALDREIATRTTELTRLRQSMAEYQARVESGPAHEAKLIELTRDYDILNESYKALLSKKEETSISADLERQHASEQFRIVDAARVPDRPMSPNRPFIAAVGLGIGLALGFGLTVLLELRDQSFRSAPEIIDVLSLPVLAMVPAIPTRYERRLFVRRLSVGVGLLAVMAIIGGGLFALRSWW